MLRCVMSKRKADGPPGQVLQPCEGEHLTPEAALAQLQRHCTLFWHAPMHVHIIQNALLKFGGD